jgi:hypothetical protein
MPANISAAEDDLMIVVVVVGEGEHYRAVGV